MAVFWCQIGFGKRFGASWSNHWAGHHQLLCIFFSHFLSHVTIWLRNSSWLLHVVREDNASKWIFDFWLAHESPTYRASSLSNLLPMQNNYRMINTEFFSNFSCSCKRISFDDGSQSSPSASNGWPLGSSSRLSSSLQNTLNHYCTVHLLAVPGPNVLLVLQTVSAALQPILTSNKKIAQICFLSNIISIV